MISRTAFCSAQATVMRLAALCRSGAVDRADRKSLARSSTILRQLEQRLQALPRLAHSISSPIPNSLAIHRRLNQRTGESTAEYHNEETAIFSRRGWATAMPWRRQQRSRSTQENLTVPRLERITSAAPVRQLKEIALAFLRYPSAGGWRCRRCRRKQTSENSRIEGFGVFALRSYSYYGLRYDE